MEGLIMKTRLLILILFCSLGSFQVKAQLTSVPDNTSFSLQDVYEVLTYWADVFGNYPTADLESCFEQAEILAEPMFDPTWYSYYPTGSLLQFRNYGGVICIRPAASTLTTATIYYGAPDYPSFSTKWDAYGAKYTWCPSYPEVLLYMECQYNTDYGLNVGATLYSGTGTDCTKLPDGWYWFTDCSDDPTWTLYYHVVNGVIESIQTPS